MTCSLLIVYRLVVSLSLLIAVVSKLQTCETLING